MCVHVGGVCIGISATDEVLNYKAFRYGGIVCYSSVWLLSFYGRSQGDKPLDVVTWLRRLHKHTHVHTGRLQFHGLMIRVWQQKSLHRLIEWPFSSVTNRLFSWQWAEAVVDLKRRSRLSGE